jgi:hypothetical protein
MPRTHIGSLELTDAVKELLHIFEIPLHIARKGYTEDIKNSFTAFRACEESASLWQRDVSKQPKKGKPFDHTIIYTYYKELLDVQILQPWAFFSLFLLVFPTGNAMSERGFSAMGATHSKQRSELSHEKVLASMVIGFNGPPVFDFSSSIDRESREKFGPEWWGYVHPSTSSM